MILGIDISWSYPYIALLVLGVSLLALWRLLRYVGNATGVLTQLVAQVGTNGKSTLRAELTALALQNTQVLELLQKKSKEDKESIAKQDVVLAEQGIHLAELSGMISVFDKALTQMGFDKQIRSVFEAMLKKEIATTTLNIIQASAEQIASGNTSAGQDVVKRDKTIGGDSVQGSKVGGDEVEGDKTNVTKIEGVIKGTLTETGKEIT